MIPTTHRSWRILLQTVTGTSCSVFLFLTPQARAIVDSNNNGLSDLWEKHYNSGNLYTDLDPLADPDGDGWTNAQEAAAGTDPLDSNPPAGILRPDAVHSPETWADSNGDGILEHTPGAITLTWVMTPGKRYTVLRSPDLTEGSWVPSGESFIGNGNEVEIGLPFTQSGGSNPDKYFWRVSVTDIDSDGDDLTDSEENQLGTDPEDSDTDGDSLPDGWETVEGLDPNDDGSLGSDYGANGDPDGDGIPNATDSTPFQMDEFKAIIDSVDIQMFSDQGGHYHTESSFSQEVSIDRLFLRYPSPGLSVPLAWIFTSDSGAFGEMVKAKIKIQATEPSTQNRRIKVTKVLDFSDAAKPAEFKDPMVFVIPAGSVESQTIEVNPGVEDLDGENPDPDLRQVVLAIPVGIAPARKMAGVFGDVIKSVNIASDIKHYVTPQKTTELPQKDVILEAVGISVEHITPGHPNQLFEWEQGEEVDGNFLKRRVSRDLAGEPTKVKLKAKNGGMIAAEMHVWVVWTDVTITQASASFTSLLGGSIYEVPDEATTGWRFVFRIKPQSIVDQSNLERPSLSGTNRKPPPGNGNTYTIRPVWGEADTANFKWDLSRQYQLTIRNPGLIPKADLEQGNVAAAWIVNQPADVDRPITFPAGGDSPDVEGNDDPSASFVTDEDRNPYAARTDNSKLNHQLGELASYDAPKLRVLDNWGGPGRSYAVEYNFKEFVRVELTDGKRDSGQFWFRISDHVNWHHYLDTTYSSATSQWNDTLLSPSSSGTGHPKP